VRASISRTRSMAASARSSLICGSPSRWRSWIRRGFSRRRAAVSSASISQAALLGLRAVVQIGMGILNFTPLRPDIFSQTLTELMLEAGGPLAQVLGPVDPVDIGAPNDDFLAALAPRYCNMRKTTIYAGSNEIQRNIIARHALGL